MVKKGNSTKILTTLGLSTVLLFSNTALAASPLLKLGSSGSEVREVQEKLKELGYYNYDSITGYFGNVTREAVIEFQGDKGLVQDGIIGESTRKLLMNESPQKRETSRNNRESLPTLKEGDSGDAVKELQQALKDKGYYTYLPDGQFGPGTKSAVIRFQQDNNIEADGIAGQMTWQLLLQPSYEEDNTEPVSESTGKTSAGGILKNGDKGQAVEELQTALKNKGFYLKKIDGDFGSLTEIALKEFQKFAGLTSDGVAGAATMSKLKENFPLLKKGASGNAVSYIQQKLKEAGFYSSIIDGDFGAGTEKALKAFQKSEGISADGVLGPGTMAKLQSIVQSASRGGSSNIQKLYWESANKIWSRDFGHAVIIDYETGKSFNVVRTGGTNHADVETASAADTRILKEIYGGSFSWDRRAVIVVVNGKRLAASMAGMPHAGRDDKPNRAYVSGRSGGYGYGENLDGIKGNNMDGVIDVHFLGSRTHDTNRVDSKHQAQINRIK